MYKLVYEVYNWAEIFKKQWELLKLKPDNKVVNGE